MAGNQLTASSAGGSQGSTQNPQTAGAGNFLPGQRTNSVQSGTPTATLNSSTGGIKLGSSSPTVVNVASAPTTTSTKKEIPKEPHHTSPLGLGLSVLFVIAAVILLWSAARPVKNTTD